MCLAIIAPKGVSKNSNKLYNAIKTASTTNKDGMGFAYKRNSTKKVYLSKGYYDVKLFIKAIEKAKLKENDELIVHLRIGNKGAVNNDMCHPFVASDKEDVILSNDKFVDDPVFIHNGTLSKYALAGSTKSDTYFFARDFLSYSLVIDFMKKDSDLFAKLFSTHLETSRVAILFPNENTNVKAFGKFIKEDGYYFSNSSYKTGHRNVGGVDYYEYNGSENERYDDYWNGLSRHRNHDYYNNQPAKKTTPYVEKTSSTVNTNTSKIDSINFEDIKIPNNITYSTLKDYDTGKYYNNYMGIWIPDNPLDDQIDKFRIDINELNFSTVRLKCLSTKYNTLLIEGKYYKIVDFDDNPDFYSRVHTISHLYSMKEEDLVAVSGIDLMETFDVKPSPTHIHFYNKYIELVNKVAISKNEMKRLSKEIRKRPLKNSIYYKKIGYFDRNVLDLFLYNMYQYFYEPEEALEVFMEKSI